MTGPDQSRETRQGGLAVLARRVSLFYRDFSVRALEDLDLEVRRGEIFGLIGPRGAGKSAALGILSGQIRPTYGTVRVMGMSPPRAARHGRVGLVAGKNAGEGAERKPGWLERMGGLFRRQAPTLSAAAALARKPDVILFDNPFAGLNAADCQSARELILGLRGEGRTILLACETLLEAKGLCHRIAILYAGRVEATGTLEELLASPGSVRVLAPVIPEASLNRALALIREDLGVAAEAAPGSDSRAEAVVSPSGSAHDSGAASATDVVLNSLLKAPPTKPPNA